MVPRITSILLALAALAQADIDFTPQTRKVPFEGAPYTQTYFRNGDGIVYYEPPGDWTVQGQGPRLIMRSPQAVQTTAVIQSRPVPSNAGFDADSLQKLKDEIAATLPREAENVAWADLEINPVLLNTRETRRLTVTYSAFAQSYTVTMIVCNFQTLQVCFRLDSRTEDFEKQYDLLRRSLYSWQGLK
jgi:hypothetical protein